MTGKPPRNFNDSVETRVSRDGFYLSELIFAIVFVAGVSIIVQFKDYGPIAASAAGLLTLVIEYTLFRKFIAFGKVHVHDRLAAIFATLAISSIWAMVLVMTIHSVMKHLR